MEVWRYCFIMLQKMEPEGPGRKRAFIRRLRRGRGWDGGEGGAGEGWGVEERFIDILAASVFDFDCDCTSANVQPALGKELELLAQLARLTLNKLN